MLLANFHLTYQRLVLSIGSFDGYYLFSNCQLQCVLSEIRIGFNWRYFKYNTNDTLYIVSILHITYYILRIYSNLLYNIIYYTM